MENQSAVDSCDGIDVLHMERLTADCCFCAFVWQDMEDDELRQVLIYGVGKAGLAFNDMADIDAVIALIAQKRRMPGFGNAGTVNSLVNFAKAAKSKRIGEAQNADDAVLKYADVC